MDTRENWNIKEIGWGGFLKTLYRHHKPDGGALILRLVIGILMVAAGWWKIQNPELTAGFFQQMGFSLFQSHFVSWVEFLGGLLLILGLLTKPVCVAFAIEMAVIVWGTAATPSIIYWGHDYNFVLLGAFLALYVMGPGKYSLAYLWRRRQARLAAMKRV